MTTKNQLLLQLFETGAVRFGNFTLRSGMQSPFYLDFRKVVSYPSLFKTLCEKLWEKAEYLSFDLLCGVPYAASSFTAAISMMQQVPMLVKRKERKKYGTGNLLEGKYAKGQKCLVIEDIVTSGISLLETLQELEKEGLEITDVVVIVDRQQGGGDLLRAKGYRVHTLFTVDELLGMLYEAGKIGEEEVNNTKQFIAENYILPAKTIHQAAPVSSVTIPPYQERISQCHHPVSRRLLEVVERKQSNLTFSADVETSEQLLHLADEIGPHICCLKTHIDTFHDFNAGTARQLKAIADKHRFLLFEDRKFCDIGHIARKQFTSPHLNIPEWVDMVTVHVVAGASSVQSLKDTGLLGDVGLIIVAEMSTKDTMTDAAYIKKAAKIAEDFRDCVIGIVAQQRLSKDTGLLQFTPGIHLAAKGDAHGQTYNNPTVAFNERGTDIMIVGRGIYQSENPVEQAKAYKKSGWEAYLGSLS